MMHLRPSYIYGAGRKGFVLVAILLLIMLCSMVAVSLLFRLKAEDTVSEALAGSEQAYAAAMSGIQEAMRVAYESSAGDLDWRDNPRTFRDRFFLDSGSDRWFYTIYSPPDDDALEELRYGLTDEASKLNINAAHTTNLAHLPRMTVPLIASLRDFIDWDEQARPEGAEQEYYDGLAKPYLIRNNVLDSLGELLLVKGFSYAQLLGEDANFNFVLDPNENDGEQRPPMDNNDGRLDRGLQQFLTVVSYERNVDNDGAPRTRLSAPADPLPGVELPAAFTNFVSAVRSNRISFRHTAELLEGKIKVKDDKGKEVELPSGIGKEELPLVLDLFTTTSQEKFPGLININTASLQALNSVPGIDEPLAEAIVSTRRSISPERRATVAWLFQEGLVDAVHFKQLAPFLTTRASQFSFRIVGYGLNSGYYRVLDVMIDVASSPRVIWHRDQTRLGLPFKIDPERFQVPGSQVSGAPERQKHG